MRALGRALLIATFVMNAMGMYAHAAEATKTTLTSSPALPSATTPTITFTAAVSLVSGAGAVTAGSVVFSIDGAPQPAVALNASGVATLATSGRALNTGLHTIAADYQGTPDPGGFAPSSATLKVLLSSPISISPSILPAGVVGQPYSQSLTASGGQAPYAFAHVDGVFPAGLTLSGAGVVSGTPTTAFNYNFGVVVTDATGLRSEKATINLKTTSPVAPPFSRAPRVTGPTGASVCTPRLMNFTSPSLPSTQSWWIRASSTTLVVGIYAVSVNVREESGGVTGTIYDGASAIGSVSATYPLTTDGDELHSVMTAPATVGRVYRLEISNGAATSTIREARHYRLKVGGADEIAFNGPLYNLEGASKDASRWGLNVNAGESLDVTIERGNIAPSASADVMLVDPSGALARAVSVVLPYAIAIPSAAAGQWTLAVRADEHYTLQKTSGSDRGVYATWDTAGTGTLNVAVTATSGAAQPLDVTIVPVGGGASTMYVGVTSVSVSGLAAGEYDVTARSTGAYTVSPATRRVQIACDGTASASFTETPTSVPLPTVSVEPIGTGVLEGNAGWLGVPMFQVRLSAVSTRDVTVDYVIADGTATSGSDHRGGSGTLLIPAGTTTNTVNILVNGDLVYERDETLSLTISNPTNAALGTATATGTILNDDPAPVISIDKGASAFEGNSGPTPMTFGVTLTGLTELEARVNYATTMVGTATAAMDYLAASGTIVLPPGTAAATITIGVIGDVLDEADETLEVRLTSAVGATIGNASAQGTIIDDDDPPRVSIATRYEQAEGDRGTTRFLVPVTLDAISGRDVLVSYATTDRSAVAGSDYTAASGSLVIPAGSSSATIALDVTGDVLYEDDELLDIELTGAINATVAWSLGSIVIVNDDAPPVASISVSPSRVTEGDSGVSGYDLTISLSAPAGKDIRVGILTADGTAVSSSDYQVLNGSSRIPAGSTSVTIYPTVNGDTTFEGDETFTISVVPGSDYTIGTGTVTVTIVDDDPPMTVTIGVPSATTYILRAPVAAAFACTGAVSCVGTVADGSGIDTASVGAHTFKVVATDRDGKTLTSTVSYRVVYAVTGLTEPGRTHKLGSTVPIKFQLRDANGVLVTDATARVFAYLAADGVVPDAQPAEEDLIPDAQDTFRWADDHYQYNLGTKIFSRSGLYAIFVDLDDGTFQRTTVYLKT